MAPAEDDGAVPGPSSDGLSAVVRAPRHGGRDIPDSFRTELYFLVAQFLESDRRTKGAAEELRRELDRERLLVPRYDWRGQPHPKTLSDVQRESGRLSGDHLLRLCFRLSGGESDSSFTGVRTLLGSRHRHASARPLSTKTNTAQALFGYQYGLPSRLSPRSWHTRLAQKMRRLRRTLGHLSSVYCLLFDRTGKFVFTGADDLLVKCWRVYDGRLIHTFRGASSEISDLAVSHDNRLLAAGSCDKVIRVWCTRTATPVAVLAKHTAMITAVHFCPFSLDDSYFHLASTSGDGTVCFWRYGFNDNGVAEFEEMPTRYHEKIRPGQAQVNRESSRLLQVHECCKNCLIFR